MATEQQYKRDANGNRIAMGGMNTVVPADLLPPGKYPYLQNVRAYTQGRTIGRARQSDVQMTLGSAAVHSLRRMNDTTPAGPASGYALIGGSDQNLYCAGTQVDSGFSGNPLALIPFRPNASPQPWMYIGDSNKMVKVRSDGTVYKTGVKEPQNEPVIGTESTTVSGTLTVLGTARPWSNVSGANPSFNYSDNGNGTGPSVISTPLSGSSLTLIASGSAVISGVTYNPGDAAPSGATNPGHFATSPVALLGAWTDSSGNIVTGTGGGVVSVGFGTTIIVPVGATRLQLGVDGTGGAFSGNTGSFNVGYSLTTSSVSTTVSLLGDVTAYYWGDSPHSGPVATYIWKNAGDSGGSGPVRSIGDASGNITGNSFQFDTTPSNGTVPVNWDVLDETGAVLSEKTLFEPALESQGYQDFNVCVVGNLFIPAAGSYTFTVTSKDNVMWGIGANASWPGSGTLTGANGQTETVVSKCPLLPSPTINGSGAATTISVLVTFPGSGVYPIELDWDYWFHNGRTLVVTCNGAVIPPIAGAVKTNVSYRYTYRSSLTGATSNPSPASLPASVPSIANTVTPEWSSDPQVDKIDYYRQDAALDSFTYVGTGPNTNPPTLFTDTLLDQEVAGNPLLEFDNFEPFPSIDLPMGGVVNVIGGIVNWVSGDQFNTRWLPGTIINIGGIPTTLYNRPSSATTLRAVNASDGNGLVYEIAEPDLAAQPLPSLWGDTDNTAYAFGCGDPLRPGTLYWCKGNDMDSAPDTNQLEVTSPSEPLVNGVIANGIGMVFSAENGWMIYPNFSSASATILGTEGNAFSLIRSGVTRGLYIRPCICTDGSGSFFYRSKDGIEMSSAGGKQTSLTDADLFNLFPHEGITPSPITVATYTVFPPDDSKPENQKLSFATGYLYYDYRDTSNIPRTLVLDVAGGGWVVDSYQIPATLHMLEEGPDVNGTLLGGYDGSVRALGKPGVEVTNCVVVTPAINAGDARAVKQVGDIFVRANLVSPLNVLPYQNQMQTLITGSSPTSIAAGGTLQNYIIDFTDGRARDVVDIGLAFNWQNDDFTFLDLWQPDFIPQPETTQDRPTDWTDAGGAGAQFWQGLILEADTFNTAKTIFVQSGDDMSLHAIDQSPVTFNGQSKQALTFTPPFIAHSVRIVATDGVPWRYYGASWVTLPVPENVAQWQTEFSSLECSGWAHLRQFNMSYISTADITMTIQFDPGAVPQQIVLTLPNSSGLQVKVKITCPANKWKLVSFRLNSSQPFRHYAADMECKVKSWGVQEPYRNIRVIGGSSAPGAQI